MEALGCNLKQAEAIRSKQNHPPVALQLLLELQQIGDLPVVEGYGAATRAQSGRELGVEEPHNFETLDIQLAIQLYGR